MKNKSKNTIMEVNGFKVTLNMPKALKNRRDSKGKEVTQGLPPYNPRPAFAVEEYVSCPDSWMRGSSIASSYFVPILPEHGMWLDLTPNSNYRIGNDFYDVAAVISIQGINPLTGLKSDPIRLEKYQKKCPKHDKDFGQDRFCSECKFEWHPQNYLCSNNGSPFWIDGFRTEDGTIRQWYFTEEECKGVAAQILGEGRVFAIGIAFYLSKKSKLIPYYPFYPITVATQGFGTQIGTSIITCSTTGGAGDYVYMSAQPSMTKGGYKKVNTSRAQSFVSQKTIEIGAGSKITQKINPDPQDLSYWQEEPSGFIYINYCSTDTGDSILKEGRRKELEEGFLTNLNLKDS